MQSAPQWTSVAPCVRLARAGWRFQIFTSPKTLWDAVARSVWTSKTAKLRRRAAEAPPARTSAPRTAAGRRRESRMAVSIGSGRAEPEPHEAPRSIGPIWARTRQDGRSGSRWWARGRPASTPPGRCSRPTPPAEVDLIERLPTPWGLVRLGVAPDHPKIKSVSKAFERIAERPGFRFLGNVEVGRDLTHDDLLGLYDAVIYAVGAQTDRRMGIPGEDLPGSWSATEFVAWYNGHPDQQHLRLRPLGRARGRDRERQRRGRRRADARAHARGARADRHDGCRDRRDRQLPGSARS